MDPLVRVKARGAGRIRSAPIIKQTLLPRAAQDELGTMTGPPAGTIAVPVSLTPSTLFPRWRRASFPPAPRRRRIHPPEKFFSLFHKRFNSRALRGEPAARGSRRPPLERRTLKFKRPRIKTRRRVSRVFFPLSASLFRSPRLRPARRGNSRLANKSAAERGPRRAARGRAERPN